jgi:glycosyltransferase involved in cell wall biosynthesis
MTRAPLRRREHPEHSTEPLSIALDATLWDEPTTGIGLYTRKLAGALQEEGARVRRLGARQSGENPRGDRSRTAYSLGKLANVLSTLDEPLFHALANFNLPPVRVRGKRLVLTVHDLIPELLPQTVSLAFRWQFRLWLARSVRLADAIICVSRRTREDLAARFQVDPGKLKVIYHGIDHVDAVAPPDVTTAAFVKSLALPQSYVLYAGALDARKNVEVLLAAALRLKARSKPVTLVLAGQNWYGSGALATLINRAQNDGADIRSLGYQPEPVFYHLIRHASVFAYPSRYEGFGLPPLEAMRLGVPVAISTAGALPEVCGEAAVQVPTDDVDGWAAAIERLLKSPEERRERVTQGRARAAQFTWREAARRTLDTYREVLSASREGE